MISAARTGAPPARSLKRTEALPDRLWLLRFCHTRPSEEGLDGVRGYSFGHAAPVIFGVCADEMSGRTRRSAAAKVPGREGVP